MCSINSIFSILIISMTMLSVEASELTKVDCSLLKKMSYMGNSMSNSKEIVALNIDFSKNPVVISSVEIGSLIHFNGKRAVIINREMKMLDIQDFSTEDLIKLIVTDNVEYGKSTYVDSISINRRTGSLEYYNLNAGFETRASGSCVPSVKKLF